LKSDVLIWLNGIPLRQDGTGLPVDGSQAPNWNLSLSLDVDGRLHIFVPSGQVLVEIEPDC
jgi:hypothetical protein